MSAIFPGFEDSDEAGNGSQGGGGAAAGSTPLSGPFRLTPVVQRADQCIGRLFSSYAALVARLGEPNTTRLEASEKVPASWAFADQYGRVAYVWAYRATVSELPGFTCWNISGEQQLLDSLFAGQIYWW